jgi:hypothetical protein
MLEGNSKTRLPLRTAMRLYWPFLLGITAFQILVIFVPPVSENRVVVSALFFMATLPAMYPYLFRNAPFSFWTVACLYWFFGYILMIIAKVVIYSLLGLNT